MAHLQSRYKELLERYGQLDDMDFNTAFYLMHTASSLQEYYEGQLARYRKLLNQIKVEVEATRAKRSIDLSPVVAKGDRQVKCDQEYVRQAKKQATAQYIVDMAQAKVNMLGRIYFDCKMLYEKANRRYREGRD